MNTEQRVSNQSLEFSLTPDESIPDIEYLEQTLPRNFIDDLKPEVIDIDWTPQTLKYPRKETSVYSYLMKAQEKFFDFGSNIIWLHLRALYIQRFWKTHRVSHWKWMSFIYWDKRKQVTPHLKKQDKGI